MKKLLPWAIGLGVLAIIALWAVNSYNAFVAAEEEVESAWAQVENQYQRRADLVPNLVASVKGYAAHEQQTLEGVVEARAKATLAVAENYPDLKANENFRDLQAQLEGTENRIAVARQLFNETAKSYNKTIRRFPNNILAGMFGFEKKPYFEAEEGAAKAPKVEF